MVHFRASPFWTLFISPAEAWDRLPLPSLSRFSPSRHPAQGQAPGFDPRTAAPERRCRGLCCPSVCRGSRPWPSSDELIAAPESSPGDAGRCCAMLPLLRVRAGLLPPLCLRLRAAELQRSWCHRCGTDSLGAAGPGVGVRWLAGAQPAPGGSGSPGVRAAARGRVQRGPRTPRAAPSLRATGGAWGRAGVLCYSAGMGEVRTVRPSRACRFPLKVGTAEG